MPDDHRQMAFMDEQLSFEGVNHMRHRHLKPAGVIAGATCLLLVAHFSGYAEDKPLVAQAHFNADGSVTLPTSYRQWVHVGTRYKPDGTNILDGKPITIPEVMNAYVEPGAFAAFEKTGRWPDGAQLVKEFSQIESGPGCNPQTYICKNSLGTGIFEAGYFGLGMMVKDAKRFPNSPGNWGYFNFGHRAPPYDSQVLASPRAKCSACHENLASDTDYVISRAHIGLAK
jgi:hypothetical protein